MVTKHSDQRMRRIVAVGRFFRILSVLVFAFNCGFVFLALFSPLPEALSQGATSLELQTDETVSISRVVSFHVGGSESTAFKFQVGNYKPAFQWVIRPVMIAHLLFFAVGAWLLRRLFLLYEMGRIFTVEDVHCLKLIGLWLLCGFILGNAFELSQLIWSISPMVHLRLDEIFFGGVLLLLVAWIMDEGRKIREEAELTI